MFLHLLATLYFLFLSTAFSENLMNQSMYNLHRAIKEKCKIGTMVPLSKELFLDPRDVEIFGKQLDELLIAKPANACELLKHPKIFSVISVLPQMNYEGKDKEKFENVAKKIEIEFSRKFYISNVLLLKEKFSSIEKESIEKKRALNATDFYLRGVVACIDTKCPHSIFEEIFNKIQKKSSNEVYGLNVKQLFLDENNLEAYFRLAHYFSDDIDLTYNNSSAMKTAMRTIPSKEVIEKLQYIEGYYPNIFAVVNPIDWIEDLYSKEKFKKSYISIDELKMDNFISKNVIGFARPESVLVDYATTKEVINTVEVMRKTYEVKWVAYVKPDWKSESFYLKMDQPFKKKEIRYEVDYFNVYGAINSENGNWFLIKNEVNKEFWIHQSQFYDSESLSTLLLESYLSDDVRFYESPGGTMTKKNSSDLLYTHFNSKAFKWIKDQLWILVDTADYEPCDGGSEVDSKKKNNSINNLWIKAFKDDGSYNFLHASRGC